MGYCQIIDPLTHILTHPYTYILPFIELLTATIGGLIGIASSSSVQVNSASIWGQSRRCHLLLGFWQFFGNFYKRFTYSIAGASTGFSEQEVGLVSISLPLFQRDLSLTCQVKLIANQSNYNIWRGISKQLSDPFLGPFKGILQKTATNHAQIPFWSCHIQPLPHVLRDNTLEPKNCIAPVQLYPKFQILKYPCQLGAFGLEMPLMS